jgi:hypothetical protein
MEADGDAAAYPTRDPRLAPDVLRPLGIEAACPGTPSYALASLQRMRARGWATHGNDGPRIGWMQRRPQHPAMGLFALVQYVTSRGMLIDPDRDSEGWLTVSVRAYPDGRGSLELRGEVDAAMDEAVRRLVTVTLAATVVRAWDPTLP